MRVLSVMVMLATAASCGDSTGSPDAGGDGVDAAARDTGVDAPPDSSTRDGFVAEDAPRLDAPMGDDAGADDAGVDGGTDAGTDAGPPEACPTEGMTRTAPCGSCGMGRETCLGGVWVAEGTCFGEGECSPGSIESRALPRCGEEARFCTDACGWLPWEETTPGEGACDPGELRYDTAGLGTCTDDEIGEEVCSSACAWEPSGVCVGECGVLRETPFDSEEVCVPAGLFVRGHADSDSASLIRDVYVSSYAIDRFPVTNRRYRACRAAGGCTGLLMSGGEAPLADDTRLDFFVQAVRWEQAVEFCAWDGGRRLPTEAEWEKAARGPHPRAQQFLWGEEFDCDVIPAELACAAPFQANRRINSYPGTRSFYGVDDMIANGWEWVSDWLEYYDGDESLSDPSGPATDMGFGHSMRGRSGINSIQPKSRERGLGVSSRAGGYSDDHDGNDFGPTFRCARSGLE